MIYLLGAESFAGRKFRKDAESGNFANLTFANFNFRLIFTNKTFANDNKRRHFLLNYLRKIFLQKTTEEENMKCY